MTPFNLSYRPVQAHEFGDLFILRALAMQATPVQFGAITPANLQKSFLAGMQNNDAWHILLDGAVIGFYALHRAGQGLWLSQLHLHPDYHNRGIGSAVLTQIIADADRAGLALHVAALRGSPANRFYLRHGFVKSGEDTWDIFYRHAQGGK